MQKFRRQEELIRNIVDHLPRLFKLGGAEKASDCSHHQHCLAAESALGKGGWPSEVATEMKACDGQVYMFCFRCMNIIILFSRVLQALVSTLTSKR
jgi:hypothetical protein